MPRGSMGLTLEDLRILSQILQESPKSVTAAAELVELDRSRLNRLIERVNDQIGEELNWRDNGVFSPPPEVRRLILAFNRFDDELNEMASSPRVSAGASISLLLLSFLQQQKRVLGRFSLLRSRQVIQALMDDQIDVAFLHNESLKLPLDIKKQTVVPKIEAVSLLEWQAKVISPKVDNSKLKGVIEWERGSMGERLSQLLPSGNWSPNNGYGLRIQSHSFLEAIEMVRRGLVGQAVVPDIYLRASEPDLKVLDPEKPGRGDIIALYRVDEYERWDWLLDKQSWEKIRNQI